MEKNSTEGSESAPAGKGARRKGTLLRAAAAVFREHGFAAGSAEEIAARVNTAKGNVFYHFGSKHELLVACHEHSLGVMRSAVAQVRAEAASPEDALRGALEALAICALDDLDGAAFHTGLRSLPGDARERIAALRDALEQDVAALVSEGVSAGVFRAIDAGMAAGAMLDMLEGLARRSSGDGGRAAAIVSLALDGLRVPADASAPGRRRVVSNDDPEEWLRR